MDKPSQSIEFYGLKLSPEDVRPWWDSEFKTKLSANPKHFYYVLLTGNPLRERDELDKKEVNGSLKFRSWRDEQLNRSRSQFHPDYSNAIGHFPVCLELSKGCSVGCWFCGISAPKLEDIFLYNEVNSILWKDVLKLMREFIGSDASSGFCFWASDPMDNHDYEKFCVDFYEVLGKFPPTTTAQPHKHPERLKALINLSSKMGGCTNRFSIISLKVLNEIHAQFTPEELATVELAFQNPESLQQKAITGKNRTDDESIVSDRTTIACVTGFLFNMVDRSVKLISPCPASKEWPDGYIIFDEGKFSSINDLETLIDKMLSAQNSDNNLLEFRSDLEYKVFSNGFQLSTKYITYKFDDYPFIQELGNMLHGKPISTSDLISSMKNTGLSEVDTLYLLDKLLKKGVITKYKAKNNTLLQDIKDYSTANC